MTRALVAAMDEYLEVADSLERRDLSPAEARPVLEALRVAHRNLLDQLKAFEGTVGARGAGGTAVASGGLVDRALSSTTRRT